jgi:HTH-type transcriptional regulator/antitoxin HigA
MIKNEHQYFITKKQLENLRTSIEFLKNFDGDAEIAKPTSLELELELGHIQSQIACLEEELEEYHKIKNGIKVPSFPKSITDIGGFLVQLRIAANLSQAELAKLVNTRTQVIQRYEATNYATANLARVVRIVEAINSKKKNISKEKNSA